MGVEEVRDPVQAHGGLSGAGTALHAHAAAQAGADDLVLLGLDRRDDVAHRAHAGAFDLRLEQLAGLRRFRRVREVLVLVRRQLAAGVAESAAQAHVERVLLRGPVERLRDGRAPVDDHRVAVGVVDVPAADVEPLPLGALREVRAGGVEVVEAAEEEGGVGEVGEGLDAVVDLALEDGGVHPVRGDVLDVEGLDVFAHGAERGAGPAEVGAFVEEGVGVGVVPLHGVPPAVLGEGGF
ncbi:hypothetical protein SXANM310S_07451 [Streptomyces xanthochromogenes]